MTTRKNWCPNPACTNNSTGWGGNSTFARKVGITGMPVTTGINWTGNGFSQTPTGDCVPGDVFTVSFYMQNNSGFGYANKTVYIGYRKPGGGDPFPQTFLIASIPSGTTFRASFTTAAAPASIDGIYLIIDSINGTNGTGFDISAVLYEKVSSLDTYFDGSFPNSSWDGTPGNSTSTFTSAPIIPPGAFLPLL